MMNDVDRILVTGDVLRPCPEGISSNQRANIDWFFHFFEYQLRSATGLDVKTVQWGDHDGDFDSPLFYALNGLGSKPKDWLLLYHAQNYSDTSFGLFRRCFERSMVIGFELPEIFMAMLERLGVPFVDVIIHPVRYLDDIFFGFRTNRQQVFHRLQPHQMDTRLFSVHAGIQKGTICRMDRLPLVPGSALFAGQTEIDKSLVCEGKLLTLLDFEDRWTQIHDQYARIYFKKHPYVQDSAQVGQFLSKFDKVEFVDDNFYRLLGNDAIDAVYSISSSTVLEARYWGKHSEYFFQNPFDLAEEGDGAYSSRTYLPVYTGYLNPAFWSDILSDMLDVTRDIDIDVPDKPNRLRTSLQNFWGYSALDADILLKHASFPTDPLAAR